MSAWPFPLRDPRQPIVVGKLRSGVVRTAMTTTASRFALVHRLAQVIWHQRQGCRLCQEDPALCPVGRRALGVGR